LSCLHGIHTEQVHGPIGGTTGTPDFASLHMGPLSQMMGISSIFQESSLENKILHPSQICLGIHAGMRGRFHRDDEYALALPEDA
jgi:hypothetical protein